MYYQRPLNSISAYPVIPQRTQTPSSSISYRPVASSTRLLFKDDTWELQFVTTTYEVVRQTVTENASSISLEYIDKYMIIINNNHEVFETIYLN